MGMFYCAPPPFGPNLQGGLCASIMSYVCVCVYNYFCSHAYTYSFPHVCLDCISDFCIFTGNHILDPIWLSRRTEANGKVKQTKIGLITLLIKFVLYIV